MANFGNGISPSEHDFGPFDEDVIRMGLAGKLTSP